MTEQLGGSSGPDVAQQIQAALEANPRVSEWVVRRVARREVQLYLVRQAREALRQVESETVTVQVHNDHPAHGPARGVGAGVLTGSARSDKETGGPVDPSVGPGGALRRGVGIVRLAGRERGEVPELLEQRLAQAAFMASLADNELFHLPGAAGGYPAVQVFDPALAADPAKAAEELAERLLQAVAREAVRSKAESGVEIQLSSAEFFLAREEVAQRNSAGARGEFTRSEAYVEMVLGVKTPQGKESERYVWLRRRRLADLRLEEWVREQAAYACDAVLATPPATGTVDLVVEREDVARLLQPILFHASGAAAYLKLARLAPGQSLWNAVGAGREGGAPSQASGYAPVSGDPIHLVSDGTLPFGMATAPFDEDGLPAQRVVVVEGNVVQNLLCRKQYADYLGLPATGGATNLILKPGSTPLRELTQAPGAGTGRVLRVADFSAFEPDEVTGNFVAEIRLGYENGRPVKGGAVRGNVFEALAGARFAAETGFFGNYQGPVAVRLPGIVVAGE